MPRTLPPDLAEVVIEMSSFGRDLMTDLQASLALARTPRGALRA